MGYLTGQVVISTALQDAIQPVEKNLDKIICIVMVSTKSDDYRQIRGSRSDEITKDRVVEMVAGLLVGVN
ncbi:hypothetical protein ACFLZR_00440 [Candidatus Neomarinimicrobiota bacterium]